MWMWEILSLAFAAAILAAIVAVLVTFDGKPSPVVGRITLNTVVAVAATLFRIYLMVPISDCICQLTWIWLRKCYRPLEDLVKFDQASRGPLGSLHLLVHIGFSPFISLASALVVIAIAIAPFFQRSVTFQNASVPVSANTEGSLQAFASSALTYKGSVGYVASSYGAYGWDVPFNLKSAIYSGLYSSGMAAMPQPPYSCPTGNCTWDPFPTLGVSVQCFDDASEYSLNCSDYDTKIPGRPVQTCTIVPPQDSGQAHMATPNTVYKSYAQFRDAWPRNIGPPFNSSRFDYGYGTGPQDNLTSIRYGYAGFQWNLARDLHVFPAEFAKQSVITSNSTIEAGYCLFYIDMKFISARVKDGLYEEHVLNASTLIRVSEDETYLNSYGMSDTEHNLLTFKHLPGCEDTKQLSACERTGASRAPNITIPLRRYLNVVAALAKILPNGNLTTSRQSGLYGSDLGESLYRSPNITKTMHTMAHYMTTAFRANDTVLAQQNDPHNITGLPADYVAPSHRGWLAFPAALVLLVAVVLTETTHESISGSVERQPLGCALEHAMEARIGHDGVEHE